MSLAAASVADPIAVGDNDPRLFASEGVKDSVLAHIIDVSDPHGTLNLITAESLVHHDHVGTRGGALGADSVSTVAIADSAVTLAKLDNSVTDVVAFRAAVNDIEITDTAAGVILRAPNASRYRIKVANDGSLSTQLVV